jgi:hypothetical protein
MLRKAHARRSLPQSAAIPAEVAKLEDRTLLLGNVVVGIDGGNVTLTGDSAANVVRISIVDNQIVVKGVLTKINGGTSAVALPMAPSTTDTLAGSLTIRMGDGIDLVDINGIKVNGNVTVHGSNGADITILRKSTVAGDLTTGVGGDAGKDSLALIDSTITGNVNASLGADFDLFIGAKLNVGGNFNLLLGDGNDVATVEVANVAGAINVDAGTGNDLLIGGFQSGGFNIQMGDGNDLVVLVPAKTTGGTASISLGTGNDGGGIGGGPIASTLTVDGGEGTDRFFIGPQVITGGNTLTSIESDLSFNLSLAQSNPIFSKFRGGFLKLGILRALLGGLP